MFFLCNCRLMLLTSVSWVCGVGIDKKIASDNIVINTDLMNDLVAGSFG